MFITRVISRDIRFHLNPGEGADAVHSDPQYSSATTILQTDTPLTGTGCLRRH
jgi:hypothetical protein